MSHIFQERKNETFVKLMRLPVERAKKWRKMKNERYINQACIQLLQKSSFQSKGMEVEGKHNIGVHTDERILYLCDKEGNVYCLQKAGEKRR